MLPKYDGRDLTMSGRVAGLRRSSSRKVVKVLYIFYLTEMSVPVSSEKIPLKLK